MDNSALVDYVDKLLLFSRNRTYSRDEAEDLTQEILFQAAKNISAVRDADKFEGWLWSVANNTLRSFRRGKGREREFFSEELTENVTSQAYCDEYAFERAELSEVYETLRKNVAYLSATYRDIIVMHYYDNATCKEISEKLNIPEGTVSYRLSVGRKKLKKEHTAMNQTALKPAKLNLYANGSYAGFPSMYINDALSKNILLKAYRQPKTAEELAKALGVPAFYIEDRIEMLLKCGAVTQPTKNAVLTNILIYGAEINEFDEAQTKIASAALSDILFEKAMELTEKLRAKIPAAVGAMAVFTASAFDLLEGTYAQTPAGYDITQKFDGWMWEYSMTTDDYKNVFYHNNRNSIKTEKCTLGHIVYVYPPFESRRAMKKEELEICKKILRCEDICDSEKEFAATALKDGFLTKSGDKLSLNVPFISSEQYSFFKQSALEIFAYAMPEYQRQVKVYKDGFVNLFPSQVKNKAAECAAFSSLFRKIIGEWAAAGKVVIEADSVCDILIEHDGGMFLR